MLSRMSPSPLHLADILEGMADAIPDRRRWSTMDHAYTYAEIDERSTRLATTCGLGIEPGEHVAVHSDNRIEWVDAFYGCLKARAVPININYNTSATSWPTSTTTPTPWPRSSPRTSWHAAQAVMTDKVRHVIVLGEQYDAALAAASTERPDPGRTPDDLYVVYTGGTTGNPKGVMWRIEDIIQAALNQARYGAPIESVEKLGEEAAANENPMVLMAAGPMMHGGSQWIMGNAHVAGQSIALYTEHSFDAEKVLDLTERAKVHLAGLPRRRDGATDRRGGPGRARAAGPVRTDGALQRCCAAVAARARAALRDLPGQVHPRHLRLLRGRRDRIQHGRRRRQADRRFAVTDEWRSSTPTCSLRPSAYVACSARTGPIPLGYYKDEAKTAATFREVGGRRWVLPGDFARREEDGTITLLGRGSVCINTGGEKVHPEEVEATLKRHPGVFDAVVVGTPHDRWGQQVTALVERREDSGLTEDELIAHCHAAIANYKCPKQIFFVDAVPRTPVSKVDYPASTARALELASPPARLTPCVPCSPPRATSCPPVRSGPTRSSGTASGRSPTSATAPLADDQPQRERHHHRLARARDAARSATATCSSTARSSRSTTAACPTSAPLQERMHVRKATTAARLAESVPAIYMVFDLLRLDGRDLTGEPLDERRELLAGLDLDGPGRCRRRTTTARCSTTPRSSRGSRASSASA